MSKQNSNPAHVATDPAPERRGIPTAWLIVGVVAVVIVIAAVIAVVASGGNDTKTAAGIEETRPVTVSGTPLPTFVTTADDPAAGTVAPTLTGASFDGTPVTVKPGKPTVVVFLAHWCPHCQRRSRC